MQRRWPRRIFIAVILACAFVLSARYGPDGVAFLEFIYLQARCAGYSAPADQVVYEEDPARAAKLLQGEAYREVRFLRPEQGSMAIRKLDIWTRYLTAHRGTAEDLRDCAPLFLHELSAPAGAKRIVYVGYSYYHLHAGRFIVLDKAKSPKTAKAHFSASAPLFDDLFPTHVLPRDLRFYAGQIDPDDPSHFTIPFQWAAQRGRVHGWLNDDLTVRFEVRIQR
jgi:hypothetical protein